VTVPLETDQAVFRGAKGIRTPDLLNAIEALYQLSYDPGTGVRKGRTRNGNPTGFADG
jgi:hypothetical protein